MVHQWVTTFHKLKMLIETRPPHSFTVCIGTRYVVVAVDFLGGLWFPLAGGHPTGLHPSVHHHNIIQHQQIIPWVSIPLRNKTWITERTTQETPPGAGALKRPVLVEGSFERGDNDRMLDCSFVRHILKKNSRSKILRSWSNMAEEIASWEIHANAPCQSFKGKQHWSIVPESLYKPPTKLGFSCDQVDSWTPDKDKSQKALKKKARNWGRSLAGAKLSMKWWTEHVVHEYN